MSPETPRQDHRITLAVLTTAALAFALSNTMVIPALPEIQNQTGASATTATWLLTAYLLTASIATPILGRLGDMYGKERVLVVVLAVFAVGSVISAATTDIGVMILGRAVQGVSGAIFPLAFGIIRDEFPREKVATGIGLISATFGIGGGVGLVVSGLIVDHLSVAWIFWLSAIVIAAAVVATHLFVPESPVRVKARIDWAGAALLSVALMALLLAISEGEHWGWTSPAFLALIVTGVLTLIGWVRFEARVPEPMVDMAMMRERTVATTNVAALLVGFGMFGSFILLPQFVQADPATAGYGFDVSVTGAAAFLLPSSAVMLFAGPLSGILGTRFGQRLPLVAGTATSVVSYLVFIAAHEQRWHIYLVSAILGLGIGLAFAAMANLVVEAVRQEQVGVATGMNTIFRTIGAALGSQLAASVLAASAGADDVPTVDGFVGAFAMSAVGVAVACGAALAIPTQRARRRSAAARSGASAMPVSD